MRRCQGRYAAAALIDPFRDKSRPSSSDRRLLFFLNHFVPAALRIARKMPPAMRAQAVSSLPGNIFPAAIHINDAIQRRRTWR
jgi:hypothetical protein